MVERAVSGDLPGSASILTVAASVLELVAIRQSLKLSKMAVHLGEIQRFSINFLRSE